MASSVETKKMGNFDMASASDRVKAFWELYPSGKIQTTKVREDSENGLLVFTAYVWKDKRDYMELAKIPGIDKETLLGTSDVNGTAKQAEGKEAKKDFEKLETISAGRALALMGFSKDGTIASTEEMEEFLKDKSDKEEIAREESIEAAVEYIKEASTIEELSSIWSEIPRDLIKKETDPLMRINQAKDEMKAKLLKGSK